MKTSISWTDREWEIFKDYINTILKENTVKVTFTKKDGTERVMKCTLQPDVLPKVELKENKKERAIPENSIAVYDIEAKDWRSFIIKSVKTVEFELA